MRNTEQCRYTYLHRKAIAYTAERILPEREQTAELRERVRFHDLDKQLMYLFREAEEAHGIHVRTQCHHMENDLLYTREDMIEAILDYESAPYTKPDKPRNAYAFVDFFEGE